MSARRTMGQVNRDFADGIITAEEAGDEAYEIIMASRLPTVPSAAWWAVVTVVWVPGLVTLIAWLIWGHQ